MQRLYFRKNISPNPAADNTSFLKLNPSTRVGPQTADFSNVARSFSTLIGKV